MLLAPGACHAPHQAPVELIGHYTEVFAKGWDATRTDRLAEQRRLGIVPAVTELPDRNLGVQPWDEHTDDERRLFARLAGAYAAMLDHFDQHLGRLLDTLDQTGLLDDTIVMVMSDNGASQEGGPLGFVNAMAPFNMIKETLDDKLARIDDIGGPDTHSNFPHGWAMAANTPLKRYKQNTHSGGVRDPLVITAPQRLLDARHAGSLRHQFCHVNDVVPTVLDLLGVDGADRPQLDGVSFAATLESPDADTDKSEQYFEIFGHRGIWQDGWKAVAYHWPGTSFDDDTWELYDLANDFNENNDLAEADPDRLAALQAVWWEQARANQVLPLDDRFGVLIAHGDATCGYSLFVRDGLLVHDLNIGGTHQIVASNRPVPADATTLGFRMERTGDGPFPHGVGTLLIDGTPAGRMETDQIFWLMISWSGLDIGLDRGTTVADYDGTGNHLGPNSYQGELTRVTVDLVTDQVIDHEAAATAELARE